MLCGQYLLPSLATQVALVFKYFSILFGLLLLLITLRKNRHRHTQYYVRRVDAPLIILTSIACGLVSSWISVGAGEFVALLLFLLGFSNMVSECIAVCVSALSVLSGVTYQLFIADSAS